MNVSTDLMSSTISPAGAEAAPPPPGGNGPPPDHAAAIQALGSALSQEAQDFLVAGVTELQESGASFQEIKAFVDTSLEASGVDVSGGNHRSGQLVDMMA